MILTEARSTGRTWRIVKKKKSWRNRLTDLYSKACCPSGVEAPHESEERKAGLVVY